MNRLQWAPSIVIGIDFGMTCTGVAYSSRDSNWGEPHVIQYWPGHPGLMNKCPSQVVYTTEGFLAGWGHCTQVQGTTAPQRYFKLALDPTFEEPTLSHANATKFYVDYMSELNRYLNVRLGQQFEGWDERMIEFRFSIPTTWTSPRLAHQLKQCLIQAGFASARNRRILFTRTEAEAAAVYGADIVQTGDVFMVIDAGGATTDINILKVVQKTGEINQMSALDKAEGINIGSVQIDMAAQELIARKLEAVGYHSADERWALAARMMEEVSFDLWKSDFGSPNCQKLLYLEVPAQNQRPVVFQSSELQEIFDNLIAELLRFVRYKILALVDNHHQERLQYIILSGGLGSSPYLKQRIFAEFCTNNRPRNTNNLQVIQTEKPQLAVAKGLVKDRPTSEYPLASSFTNRRARASYGVLIRAKYEPKLHFGQPTSRDELTGELWVEQRIDWIIREGDTVLEDGYKIGYSLRVSEERRLQPFRCTVVTSNAPVSNLPLSMVRGPVSVLCNVYGRFEASDFDTQVFQTVKRRWFFFRKAKDHNVAQFYLKVKVGSANLSFEFESLDGRTYTEEASNVDVVWADGQPPIPGV